MLATTHSMDTGTRIPYNPTPQTACLSRRRADTTRD